MYLLLSVKSVSRRNDLLKYTYIYKLQPQYSILHTHRMYINCFFLSKKRAIDVSMYEFLY